MTRQNEKKRIPERKTSWHSVVTSALYADIKGINAKRKIYCTRHT